MSYFQKILVLVSFTLLTGCKGETKFADNPIEILIQGEWEGSANGGQRGDRLTENFKFYEDGTFTLLKGEHYMGQNFTDDHTHEQAKKKGDVRNYYITKKKIKKKQEGSYENDYKTHYEEVFAKPMIVVMEDSTQDSDGSWRENPIFYFNEHSFARGIAGYMRKSCDCEIGNEVTRDCDMLCVIYDTPFIHKNYK